MTDDALLGDVAARERIETDTSATLFVEAGAGSGKTKSLVDRVDSQPSRPTRSPPEPSCNCRCTRWPPVNSSVITQLSRSTGLSARAAGTTVRNATRCR